MIRVVEIDLYITYRFVLLFWRSETLLVWKSEKFCMQLVYWNDYR